MDALAFARPPFVIRGRRDLPGSAIFRHAMKASMTDSEATSALMQNLGPATEGVEAVVERAPGQWAVRLADGGELTVELDPEAGALALMLPVAAPALAERLRVYEAALLYNSLWRETGGTRLAMAGENGTITVGLELPAAALDLSVLQDALKLLAARADTWREVIGDAPAVEGPPQTWISG
ncbi:MAG: type III secretion system chaperone [Acetobacteraceae bacterium]